MTSAELRAAFLAFFGERGHSVQPSSSLVPTNDATLLFTNAGMVQFKDVFLGREQRPYDKAATSQRCVRAGGKHNDLENVGYTARHHTFFEMLGNFSFGSYFKRDAIRYAWDFLTQILQIPPERLWVTVFEEDSEAESIWLQEINIDSARFSRIGSKDNFWSMGDVGPCGPCSEIFFDHGAHIPGGPPGSPDEDGDRYIEVWNLVFMQYDRDSQGNLTPLPKPSVDTGMGLERIAAVSQGVHSNYEIDLFQNLLRAAAELAGATNLDNSSLRVIVDHIRSCAFLVVDGVIPSNEGRGYVLRRIIRRAIRHGYRLGIREVFFYRLVAPLAAEMGSAYPELVAAQAQVERILEKEEQRFVETLEQGMKILEACVAKMTGTTIPGETVFQLYDTFGFPVDLTADFAREHQLTLDMPGFEMAMAAQRERARASSSFGADYDKDIKSEGQTTFTGYEHLQERAIITGLFVKGEAVTSLPLNEEAVVVLDQTPFYAESGGQVGDCGSLFTESGVFQVVDTQKQGSSLFLHKGKLVEGSVQAGQGCTANVDLGLRKATEAHHSATHLLHAALRQLLGEHVVQKGSLVNPERLRFDFTHFEPMTAAQMCAVENLVNAQIRNNSEVTAKLMTKDSALQLGAMALFGEKYGDEVRVLQMGEFSTELCGGTHVHRAGDIGFFKICSETGVAAGVRRIEAVAGQACVDWLAQRETALLNTASLLKTAPDKTFEKVQQLLDKSKLLEKELEKLKGKLASSAGDALLAQAVDVDGIKVLAVKLDDVDPKALRDLADQLRNKLGRCAIVLSVVADDKVSVLAAVSKDLMDKVKAGELVNSVALQVGGKGGGKPDMAQAGGNNPANLAAALRQVPAWIKQQVA